MRQLLFKLKEYIIMLGLVPMADSMIHRYRGDITMYTILINCTEYFYQTNSKLNKESQAVNHHNDNVYNDQI